MADRFSGTTYPEELEREAAIKAHLARQRPSGPSRSHCLDCDNPIPEQRRAQGGVTRCTPCQTTSEQGNRR